MQVKVSAEFQDIIFECKQVLEVWIKKIARYCVFSSFIQLYEFEQEKGRQGKFWIEKLAKRLGTTSQRRVVKVYDKHQLSKSPFLLVDNRLTKDMARNEVNTLRKLDHPNIEKFCEVFESADNFRVCFEVSYGSVRSSRHAKKQADDQEEQQSRL